MGLVLILLFAGAAVLPAIVWLLFFIREDIHPEPRKLIAYAFTLGALATIPALLIQVLFRHTFGGEKILFIFIGLALIEELFKFLAAYYAINKSPFFDEPVDAMIYMIAVASGFATVENVLITIGSLETINTVSIYSASQVLLLRFVGATLLHVLSSSVVGYAWGKVMAKKTHYGLLIQGIVLATLIHATFNLIVATLDKNNLLYSSTILIAAAFFVLNDFEILKKDSVTLPKTRQI